MPITPRPTTALRLSAVALAALLATGCSVLEETRIDYKSAKQINTLEVPPDLTQLARDSRYALPGGPVTATGMEAAAAARPSTQVAAPAQIGDVRIERAGNQRWLVVDRPPEQLWPALRDFWQENGFLLTLDQPQLGLLETDWAENRAKIPQDIIRATIGKLFDNLYSTGERDKFRTRVERNERGGSDIFISHRGMVEVYSNERKDNTVWQPRPADPELEAEFLRRLMVKLGVSQEQAKAAVAAGAVPTLARLDTVDGRPVVVIQENFDRAWRRVGLSLDRSGFTVEDRNRAEGVYFVRYVAPDANTAKQEPGFFGRIAGWFSSSNKTDNAPLRLRITVRGEGERTVVQVLDAQGQPDRSPNAERIAKLLVDDLK
ncbi:Beta-barrel assembly machine subunit BamC [Tepidimonas ignava]|uniref:Beta-barrel assembly machine subunit BamC n=1 Tax=Tepidimonas ignava TaxID=114249 RepID=A0A4R3LJ61_9BURK|nr:outer membrane protein assembly factor BamC [Tepidimonas ignava]TCS99518.1 Beta-barrel assembly machine subunit BamC [Tepidimonas ignava]TSE22018.1 Outer membrane protein assembly factor BamC [Tepidimonas ignava]